MGVVGRIGVSIGVGGALVLSLVVTSAPASAQSALVDVLSKRVTLTHPGYPAGEIAVGQVIRSGDTVATDDNGRAVVTYPDGSTALLAENSALTIEFVRTSAGDYAVRMQQTLGRVWYAVTRAVTLGSRYEVRSAGMASVIRAGSGSYVTVSPSGETTVVAIAGTVDTSAGGVEVALAAGSSTTVSGPGAVPVAVHAAPFMAFPSMPARSPSTHALSAPVPAAPKPTPPITTLPQRPTTLSTSGTRSPLDAPRSIATTPMDQSGPDGGRSGQTLPSSKIPARD